MKISELKKLFRSSIVRDVPLDLRDKLVQSIPNDFRTISSEKTGIGRTLFTLTKRKFAYIAVAAVVLIAVLHFSDIELIGPRYPNASFRIVSIAVADVIRNLENTGAFYMELGLRTRKGESLEFIDPRNDFSMVKIWLERPSERFKKGRMKIEKQERKIVFNGDSTLFHLIEIGEAQFFEGGEIDNQLANPASLITKCFPVNDANVNLDTTVSSTGISITRLTIREKGIKPDTGNPTFYFFIQFDRKTVISWNTKTQFLTNLEKYVMYEGKEVLIEKLYSIDYKDQLEDKVFSFDLPAGVHIAAVTDTINKKYSEMDPVEVANFIFNAWQNKEWDKVRLYCEYEVIIKYMQLHPIAQFRITGAKYKFIPIYPGYQIPYELVFKNGEIRRGSFSSQE